MGKLCKRLSKQEDFRRRKQPIWRIKQHNSVFNLGCLPKRPCHDYRAAFLKSNRSPTMHPRTAATLNKLQRAKWFANVGVQDTDVAIVLSSWDQAMEHCSSIEWENLRLEAFNQYRMRLLERSKELRSD
jgi:hypothetical protein